MVPCCCACYGWYQSVKVLAIPVQSQSHCKCLASLVFAVVSGVKHSLMCSRPHMHLSYVAPKVLRSVGHAMCHPRVQHCYKAELSRQICIGSRQAFLLLSEWMSTACLDHWHLGLL